MKSLRRTRPKRLPVLLPKSLSEASGRSFIRVSDTRQFIVQGVTPGQKIESGIMRFHNKAPWLMRKSRSVAMFKCRGETPDSIERAAAAPAACPIAAQQGIIRMAP